MLAKTYTTKDTYSSFPLRDKISYEEYVHICKTFNDHMFDLILQGKSVSIPSGLGKYQLVKFKPKKKKYVDFQATKELGRTVYHRNRHTDGYSVRLHWHKKAYPFTNKRLWRFKLTRHRIRYDEKSVVKYTRQHGVYHLLEL